VTVGAFHQPVSPSGYAGMPDALRRLPVLAVAAASAAMPATTSMPAEAAMPGEAAMLTEPAMLAEPLMPMRKAVAPATMIPVAMIPAITPAVNVSVVAVTNGPVTNGLRHASGQGKTDADHQQYGPRQYSTAVHRRLHFL
jgi:hypothetical protein